MQIVLTFRTAQPDQVLAALVESECRGHCEIIRMSPMADDEDRRSVTMSFNNPLDRDAFRRALAALPPPEADALIAQSGRRPTQGFLSRLFS